MRKKPNLPQLLRLTSCLLFGACAGSLLAQNYTQTITLNPGWNSVFLEVTPAATNVASVFSDPAIASVWQPRVRNSTVAFIQNPNAAPFNTAGWMVYIPTNQPQSVNNDLYTVVANTPYVVQVGGNSPLTLNITGRPSLRAAPFTTDGFTLRGFPVAAGNPPTFLSFFQSSPAHDNNGAGPLTTIYRLNLLTGQWLQANASDPMARGAAYWVFTAGASSYMAPLTASCATGDGLDFGSQTFELDLTMRNTTTNAMTVTITDLGGLPRPLVYGAVNPATQIQSWQPLPQNLATNVAAGGTMVLPLGIKRSQMVNGTYVTVLALSDGNGTELRVPVSAQSTTLLQAGLWVGDITMNAVAETYNNPTNPTPTASPFVMRAILHVTPGGTTRLLRDVIEMTQSAVATTNGSGVVTVVQPAQGVLLTDPTLLSQPQYVGVALRDGTPVGRRISTAGFDFDPPGGTNFLTMSGTFGISSTVGVTITLTPQTPTNPFLHRYNPEHDNRDFNGQPLSTNVPQEVFTVTRQIQFSFTAADPSGRTATDYGVNEIAGDYREILTGLHRNPLVVSGTFRLTHLSSAPYLNGVQ